MFAQRLGANGEKFSPSRMDIRPSGGHSFSKLTASDGFLCVNERLNGWIAFRKHNKNIYS
jgi:hypothetical protein